MPETLKKLIELIAYLPGIGEKTATKLAFFLLKANATYLKNFSDTMEKLHTDIKTCPKCFGVMESHREACAICDRTDRDNGQLCVVEDYLDMLSIEQLRVYGGKYHVLGGAISPIRGILPEQLTFEPLFERVKKDSTVKEIILAMNPNLEGEATALYIKEHLASCPIKITRLSKGLPNAGYIEYADEITLLNAFRGRVE